VVVPSKPFQASSNSCGSNPRAAYLKVSPLMQAWASTVNIRHGWKRLPGTNTQAYYENS